MSTKSMCKWNKSDYDSKGYRKAIINATHYCGKCGRATNDKKSVCKPLELTEAKEKKEKKEKKSK